MLLSEEPFHIPDRGDWYTYRLPSGECVSRQTHLGADEAEIVDDPQVTKLMTAARPVEAAVFDAYHLFYDPIYVGFPPFRILKCPLCGSEIFKTTEMAVASCAYCLAEFRFQATAADPGFVAFCTWRNYQPLNARYILPRSAADELKLVLVFKNFGDILSSNCQLMSQSGWCHARPGQRIACRDSQPLLADETHPLYQPGVNLCNLGDQFAWSLSGAVPTWLNVKSGLFTWRIDDQPWPASVASHQVSDQDHSDVVKQAARAVQYLEAMQLKGSGPIETETINFIFTTLRQLAGWKQQFVFPAPLPPPRLLISNQYFMLAGWEPAPRYQAGDILCPKWHIVEPIVSSGDHPHVVGFQTIQVLTIHDYEETQL